MEKKKQGSASSRPSRLAEPAAVRSLHLLVSGPTGGLEAGISNVPRGCTPTTLPGLGGVLLFSPAGGMRGCECGTALEPRGRVGTKRKSKRPCRVNPISRRRVLHDATNRIQVHEASFRRLSHITNGPLSAAAGGGECRETWGEIAHACWERAYLADSFFTFALHVVAASSWLHPPLRAALGTPVQPRHLRFPRLASGRAGTGGG